MLVEKVFSVESFMIDISCECLRVSVHNLDVREKSIRRVEE